MTGSSNWDGKTINTASTMFSNAIAFQLCYHECHYLQIIMQFTINTDGFFSDTCDVSYILQVLNKKICHQDKGQKLGH